MSLNISGDFLTMSLVKLLKLLNFIYKYMNNTAPKPINIGIFPPKSTLVTIIELFIK